MLGLPSVRHALRFSLVALPLVLVAPPALADSVEELRTLVDANNAADAWAMAQRMEPASAGDAEFDFWYGLAAKAAGQKHEAVFAFERVVAQQPDNPRAKLELADSYFQFGNTQQARRLFEEVLASTPPDAVQARIRTYLGAIEARDSQQQTQVRGSLTLAGGYDSNINGSTATVEHDVGPLTVTLDPVSLETDAGFVDARGTLEVVRPVSQRTIQFLNLSAQRRDNDEVFSGGNFDYSQVGLNAGWMLRRGTATWRIPVGLQALWVEGESVLPVNDDRYVMTLGLEYNRALSSHTSLTWFGQGGHMHYPSQDDRNTNQLVIGGSYNWASASTPLRVSTSLHLGTDVAEDSDFKYNGRDYATLRATLRYSLSASHLLYGGVGVQFSQYQDDQPVLGFEREDVLADASCGWQWQLERNWQVNADLSYANNDSADNALYDYDRAQVRLGSTWRF